MISYFVCRDWRMIECPHYHTILRSVTALATRILRRLWSGFSLDNIVHGVHEGPGGLIIVLVDMRIITWK